jgi:AcrR family transcriptional regulator
MWQFIHPEEPTVPASVDAMLEARRPKRADARRNFDALVDAARIEFAETGVYASLEEIAKRAAVGIGTLYRNFSSRDQLVEAVYIDEVATIARFAGELGDLPPREALMAWFRRFADYVATKHVLLNGLNSDSEVLQACRGVVVQAGEPLLDKAQAEALVRADVSMDDAVRLVSGVMGGAYLEPAQRDRVLAIALDGLFVR